MPLAIGQLGIVDVLKKHGILPEAATKCVLVSGVDEVDRIYFESFADFALSKALDCQLGAVTPDIVHPRVQVLAFAQKMEVVLRYNDHKGGWDRDNLESLMIRLMEEVRELDDATASSVEFSELTADQIRNIMREAADVANFAMMIYDRCSNTVPAADVEDDSDDA